MVDELGHLQECPHLFGFFEDLVVRLNQLLFDGVFLLGETQV